MKLTSKMVTKDAVYDLEFTAMGDEEARIREALSKFDKYNRDKIIKEMLDKKFELK